jgi:integrase
MSLYRRNAKGPWWVRICVAGNKIRKSTGTEDRAAAQEFEQRERERAWRELKLGDRSAITWREAAARWLTETKKRSKSKDEYMLAWFGGYLENESVSAIDRDTIEDLREGLREEGASESTINRYMALLRAILRKARDEWRYIDYAPKVPMYGEVMAEPRWLREDEFERLIKELPPHLKLAAEFAVLTGLRMRSMLQLTWDRVDLGTRRAWVPQSQMKGARSFGFPLSAASVLVLKRCRKLHPTGNHVFQYEGKPVDDCNTAAFQKAVKRAKLEPLRWHDLRHTFASWAVQSGVTLHELMQLGDWRSYSMVLRYGHLAPDQLFKAAELVAQKGHMATRARTPKRVQDIDFAGGERGTRTLDLGIMSATL